MDYMDHKLIISEEALYIKRKKRMCF